MLLFIGECSSIKQLHAGRDVGRLISRMAEYRIRAYDGQCSQGKNYDDVENPTHPPSHAAADLRTEADHADDLQRGAKRIGYNGRFPRSTQIVGDPSAEQTWSKARLAQLV